MAGSMKRALRSKNRYWSGRKILRSRYTPGRKSCKSGALLSIKRVMAFRRYTRDIDAPKFWGLR